VRPSQGPPPTLDGVDPPEDARDIETSTPAGSGTQRFAWAIVVVAAGAGLARGLWLTTYIEFTPDARADVERGVRWLWISTAVLVTLAWLAHHRWTAPLWATVPVVAAGPICLWIEGLGWIPLIALMAVVPLLWVGITGVVVGGSIRQRGD